MYQRVNVKALSKSCTFLLLSYRPALSTIQLQRNELKLSQQLKLFCAGLEPSKALSEHGRQIKLASPTPQIGTRPAPVVEFALVYSNRCAKLKPNVPLLHFPPLQHYTVILSRIFRHGSCRNYTCPSRLLCMAILSFR